MSRVRTQTAQNDAREAALRLLARREHAFVELIQKLVRKGWPLDQVEEVVQTLADAGLQSDRRFAEVYTRSRAEKAYGPLRIRAELGERGIDRGEVEHALAALRVDWLALAGKWYQRRYGEASADDFKEKSRRRQALARRGFAAEHIRELLD